MLTKEFYEQLARKFKDTEYMYNSRHPTTRYLAQQRLMKLESIIKAIVVKNDQVLDVGCGEGVVTAKVPGFATVIGMDISPTHIKRASRRVARGLFFVADAGALPLRNNTFDIAICSEVLEHLPNPVQCLSEINRVLKPAGRLIVTTPKHPSLYSSNVRRQIDETLRQIARHVRHSVVLVRSPCSKGFGHLRTFSSNELKKMLSWNGFTIDHLDYSGFLPPAAFLILYLGQRHAKLVRLWRAIDKLISRVPVLKIMNYRQYAICTKLSGSKR